MSTRGIFPGFITDEGKVKFDKPTEAHTFNREYFAESEVTIEIYKRRSKRSKDQNAWMHVAIKPLADKLGVTVTSLKLILLGETFGWATVLGKPFPIRDATSDLNTEEFSDVMAIAQQLAAEHGVLILDPSQWKAAKRKQQRRGTGPAPGGRGALGRSSTGNPESVYGSSASPGAKP